MRGWRGNRMRGWRVSRRMSRGCKKVRRCRRACCRRVLSRRKACCKRVLSRRKACCCSRRRGRRQPPGGSSGRRWQRRRGLCRRRNLPGSRGRVRSCTEPTRRQQRRTEEQPGDTQTWMRSALICKSNILCQSVADLLTKVIVLIQSELF